MHLAGRSFSSHISRNVLWASRIDHQKNPGILLDIARLMPELTFHMYGRRVLNDTEFDLGRLPVNVRFHGEYSSIRQLFSRNYLCFLYTSRFDGMPNVLMEMAAAGLPIVTPPVGGVTDFFGSDWPGFVPEGENVRQYIDVIREAAIEENHRTMILKQNEALKARSFASFQRTLLAGEGGPTKEVSGCGAPWATINSPGQPSADIGVRNE